nr:hypothetical protein [uncultured Desulfobulbus sp.]
MSTNNSVLLSIPKRSPQFSSQDDSYHFESGQEDQREESEGGGSHTACKAFGGQKYLIEVAPQHLQGRLAEQEMGWWLKVVV